MRIDVVSLFAPFFESPLQLGLTGRAITDGRAEVGFVDPRSFTTDNHKTVDATPYGGGAGMVMKPEPVLAALAEARTRGPGPVVMLTPQGTPLDQAQLESWAKLPHLVLLAGRYEGFDERIREAVDYEISLGDFVLTGGEYGALTIIDGVIRLLPGTVGNHESTETDSFADGLLEHPHFTRPESLDGADVPAVLRSGNHGKVAEWRMQASLRRTRERRPDLLARRTFDFAAQKTLWTLPTAGTWVRLIARATPDEIESWVELACAYGLESVVLVGVEPDALEAYKTAERARFDTFDPPRGSRRVRAEAKDRAVATRDAWRRAIDVVQCAETQSVAVAQAQDDTFGIDVVAIASDLPTKGEYSVTDPHELRRRPVALVLDPDPDCVAANLDGLTAMSWFPPVRGTAPRRSFGGLARAAVALDRLIGEG